MNRRNVFRTLLVLTLVLLVLTAAFCAEVKIGLVYNKPESAAYKDGADFMLNYRKALEENGAAVVPLFITDNNKILDKKLGEIDGVLLPGGDDVNPALYNEKPNRLLEVVDLPLDSMEYRIIKYCLANNKPILGICRGFQILNVYMKGSLYQDIPTQMKGEKKVSHRKKFKGETLPCFHEITITKGSKLYKLLETGRIKVNSLHHQGVKKLGKDLEAVAKTDDGLVEAFQGAGKVFILGTQFHPEKLRKTEPIFNNIFKAFVQASIKSKESRISK